MRIARSSSCFLIRRAFGRHYPGKIDIPIDGYPLAFAGACQFVLRQQCHDQMLAVLALQLVAELSAQVKS